MGVVKKGRLFVIDGTDGSGKKEHTDRLVARLAEEGVDVKTLSFPKYHNPSAKPVEAYLRGEFGDVNYVDSYLASALYAFDRSKHVGPMREDLERGTHYVLNRYVPANMGHQAAKILDPTARKKFLTWLFDLEYNQYGIPVPDLTLFLHMPPVVGQQFVARKEAGDSAHTGAVRQKDIHEASLPHLIAAEQAYLEASRTYPHWKVISCLRPDLEGRIDLINDTATPPEKKVRSLDDIQADVYEAVSGLLKVA